MTPGRRTLLAATAVAALSTVSVVVPASAHKGHSAKKHAVAGVIYGGFTPQGWPMVVEVSRDRREIVRTSMGFDVPCQTGGSFSDFDNYTHIPIHANGRFQTSYSDSRLNYDDGTYRIYAGSLRGEMNRPQTKFSGSVHLDFKSYAASGAVADTCDSGIVKFKLKQ